MKKNLLISSLLVLFFILSSGCNKKQAVVFVHLTDPHVNSPDREARLDSLLRDIEQLVPAPEFILVTGDQTERGHRSELQAYDSVMATSRLPVYNTPGNHELRWSPYGKNAVQEHWGNPFQSIDCGPVQLLLLDSSMLLEHYGHYSPHLLARVRRELQQLGPERPLILASHHPVMFEKRFV
ncbi:metallophosphoesterase, partial [bacterium]|nr:metallophosphoesterase [bacterium]